MAIIMTAIIAEEIAINLTLRFTLKFLEHFQVLLVPPKLFKKLSLIYFFANRFF